MTSYLDKLNLRPQERRLVVFVGLVVFVALNLLLVVPQFGKVDFWQNRKASSEKTWKTYQDEIRRISEYQAKLKLLENEGVVLGSDEAIISLQRDVEALSRMCNFIPERMDPVPRSSRTNSFFEEAGLRISVNTGEKELVDFLYNLGARNALVRIRNMNLQPDQTQTRLRGPIELVASFPKKTTAKASAAAKTPTPPALGKKPAGPGTTNLAKTSLTSTSAPPAASTNWFKKMLARFGGSSTPKTNAVAKAPPASSTKFTPRTNATPKTPNLPAPK